MTTRFSLVNVVLLVEMDQAIRRSGDQVLRRSGNQSIRRSGLGLVTVCLITGCLITDRLVTDS
jgi:hypothetical protein